MNKRYSIDHYSGFGEPDQTIITDRETGEIFIEGTQKYKEYMQAQRGWFYPTRYNEIDGEYTDEEDTKWVYITGTGWHQPHNEGFSQPSSMLPMKYLNNHPYYDGFPIAVRWWRSLDD